MSKLFSKSEYIALAAVTSDFFICPPSVVKTASGQGLAALPDSGQLGGSLPYVQRFAFVCQMRNPMGFWVRGCDAEILPRRFAEERRA